MARIVAPALRALLTRLIDYAGIYPPASLPRAAAVARYQSYQAGEYAWMLRWLVVGAADLAQIPRELDGSLSVLSDTANTGAAAIETKQFVNAEMPVYCEVAIAELDAMRSAGWFVKIRTGGVTVDRLTSNQPRPAGCFAKIRTGGVTPEAIPSVEQVAAFILACAERRLPFKATAGLHHPIRAMHPLTYDANAPRALMHGFLNLFLAAAFAWHGQRDIEPILAETDPAAFRFDERAYWRDRSLSVDQIQEARTHFAHSFGSCSFEEPIRDLEARGWL